MHNRETNADWEAKGMPHLREWSVLYMMFYVFLGMNVVVLVYMEYSFLHEEHNWTLQFYFLFQAIALACVLMWGECYTGVGGHLATKIMTALYTLSSIIVFFWMGMVV